MSQLLLHLNLNIVMLLNFLLKVCLELLEAVPALFYYQGSSSSVGLTLDLSSSHIQTDALGR